MALSEEVDLVPEMSRRLRESRRIARERVWDWSLVLVAKGIPHDLDRYGDRWRILVDSTRLDSAVSEVEAYEAENVDPAEHLEQTEADDRAPAATFWIMLAMMVFYRITTAEQGMMGLSEIPWKELGSVDTWLVHQGELWRLVTGLTLHADLAHLFSNVFTGGIFMILLSRNLGVGLAWGAVLLAGVAGNGINTLVQDYSHTAIGFSTSVFAAVGALAGVRSRERSSEFSGTLEKMAPVAAGLGLLAMLGTGGGNVDVAAHVFGFICGVVFGVALGSGLGVVFPLTHSGDRTVGIAALLLVAIAWFLAIFS